MRKNKIKKILSISLVVLLAIGTLGASLAFFGKNDFNWVKEKVEDAFVKEETTAETRNLISNSNFQLDSTGITLKTQENVAQLDSIVDDWIRQGAVDGVEFEIYKSQAGLHVNMINAGSGFYIQQYFSSELGKYSDMPLTFATSINGVVYSDTFEFTDENEGNDNIQYFDLVEFVDVGFAYLEVSSAGYKVVFCVTGSAEFTINWVHLEQGSVFTGYVAPEVEAVA